MMLYMHVSMPHFRFTYIYMHHLCTFQCMSLFRAFPDDYSKDLFKAHTESLYKGLLIHLDDPSSAIQVNTVSSNRAMTGS